MIFCAITYAKDGCLAISSCGATSHTIDYVQQQTKPKQLVQTGKFAGRSSDRLFWANLFQFLPITVLEKLPQLLVPLYLKAEPAVAEAKTPRQ